MRIEEKGYEYRGIKLGQRCNFEGEEYIIIGFDEYGIINKNFIAINCSYIKNSLQESSYLNDMVALNQYESSFYKWVNLNEIELLPYEDNNTIQSEKVSSFYPDFTEENPTNDITFVRLENDLMLCINWAYGSYGIGRHNNQEIAKALAYYKLSIGN